MSEPGDHNDVDLRKKGDEEDLCINRILNKSEKRIWVDRRIIGIVDCPHIPSGRGYEDHPLIPPVMSLFEPPWRFQNQVPVFAPVTTVNVIR